MTTPNPAEARTQWPKPEPATEQPSLADYPLRTAEKLRFSDTDCNGHISHAVFAVCCQNARMELLHDPRRVPLPGDARFVIVRLEIDFLDEMHWPGTVVVGTRCERIGRTSLTLAQVLFADGSYAASAKSTVALVDPTSRRAIPLPPETAAALQAFRAPEKSNGALDPSWRGRED